MENEHKQKNVVARKRKAKTRKSHLRRLQKAFNKKGTGDFTQLLLKKLRKAIKTLESIASSPYDAHNQYSFWIANPHEVCADVLARDTKLARETLKEISQMRGIIGDEKGNRNHNKQSN